MLKTSISIYFILPDFMTVGNVGIPNSQSSKEFHHVGIKVKSLGGVLITRQLRAAYDFCSAEEGHRAALNAKAVLKHGYKNTGLLAVCCLQHSPS